MSHTRGDRAARRSEIFAQRIDASRHKLAGAVTEASGGSYPRTVGDAITQLADTLSDAQLEQVCRLVSFAGEMAWTLARLHDGAPTGEAASGATE